MSLEYAAGDRWLLAVPDAVLLVDGTVPVERVAAAWSVLVARGGADALVEALAGGRVARLPAFACAVRDGGRLHVRTRHGLPAVVLAAGGPRAVAAGDSALWREEVVPAADALVLGDAAAAPGRLPLLGGVVRAAGVRWHPQDAAPAPHDGRDEDDDAAAVPAVLAGPDPAATFEPTVEPTTDTPSDPPRRAPETGPLPVAAARPVGRLRFADGVVVAVDRALLVGRAPSVSRSPTSVMPRLVAVDNPAQDVSRNHLEVRPHGTGVHVVDLGSANGTLVSAPGRAPQRLLAHEPCPLVPGSVVTLSEDVRFVFEGAEPDPGSAEAS